MVAWKGALTQLKLAVFDLDGTLIKPSSSWKYLHQRLGTWGIAKKNAELFYSGKISWIEWAKKDANLWAGRSVDEIIEVARSCPTTRGAKEAFDKLEAVGLDTAIISGGLSIFAERVAQELGISHVFANRLRSKNGILTGRVVNAVTQTNKPRVLEQLLKRLGLSRHETVAVGDDFTMIPVFTIVRLSIAFNPQDDGVSRSAKVTVRSQSLLDIVPHILAFCQTTEDKTNETGQL